MNGGDTNLGGPQVTPGSSTPPTSGSRPAASAGSGSKDSSPIISVPHADKAPSKPLVIKVQSSPSSPNSNVVDNITSNSGSGADNVTNSTHDRVIGGTVVSSTDSVPSKATSNAANEVANNAADRAPSNIVNNTYGGAAIRGVQAIPMAAQPIPRSEAMPLSVQTTNGGVQPMSVGENMPLGAQATTYGAQPMPTNMQPTPGSVQTMAGYPPIVAGGAQAMPVGVQPVAMGAQPPAMNAQGLQNDQEMMELLGMASQDVAQGNAENRGSRKKWWILGGIVGVLVVVAIVLGVIMGVGGGSSTNDTKTLLNIYANYLLYGVESEGAIGDETNVWNAGYIEEQLANNNAEEKEGYFTELIKLFGDFGESYKNNKKLKEEMGEDNSNFAINVIENTKTALETLKEYSATPDISVSDMKEMYLLQGGEVTKKEIADVYNNYITSENLSKNTYGNSMIGIAETVVQLYTSYNDYGCINGIEIIKECIASKIPPEVTENLEETLSDYSTMLDQAKWHIRNDPITLSNMIYDVLNVKDIENEKS